MALTSADLARLGPQAQKQVLDKLVGEQKSKKSKYGNRKVVRDGIKFDSEREAARFGELKVLRAMGKIRDLRLQANFTLVEGYTTILWLKGLPALRPTNIVDAGDILPGGYSVGASANYAKDETGKIMRWNDPRTAKARSKTFPGIARAMAEQWGGDIREDA